VDGAHVDGARTGEYEMPVCLMRRVTDEEKASAVESAAKKAMSMQLFLFQTHFGISVGFISWFPMRWHRSVVLRRRFYGGGGLGNMFPAILLRAGPQEKTI
jgi:hypothetical protein